MSRPQPDPQPPAGQVPAAGPMPHINDILTPRERQTRDLAIYMNIVFNHYWTGHINDFLAFREYFLQRLEPIYFNIPVWHFPRPNVTTLLPMFIGAMQGTPFLQQSLKLSASGGGSAGAEAARQQVVASTADLLTTGFRFVKILGYGGLGVTALFETTDEYGLTHKVVAKVSLDPDNDLEGEKENHRALKRCLHITEELKAVWYDSINPLDRHKKERIDEGNEILLIEFMKNGDLRGVLEKLGTHRVKLCNRLLWTIFRSLFKAALAMAWGGQQDIPRSNILWDETVGSLEYDDPQSGWSWIHLDLDPKNVLVGDLDKGHFTAPTPGARPDYMLFPIVKEQTSLEWEYLDDQLWQRRDELPISAPGDFGRWTNLWQVGMIMWSIVTGCDPLHPPQLRRYLFNGADAYSYGVSLIGNQEFADVDATLLHLIVKCLDHDPRARPEFTLLEQMITAALGDPDGEKWKDSPQGDEELQRFVHWLFNEPKDAPPPDISGQRAPAWPRNPPATHSPPAAQSLPDTQTLPVAAAAAQASPSYAATFSTAPARSDSRSVFAPPAFVALEAANAQALASDSTKVAGAATSNWVSASSSTKVPSSDPAAGQASTSSNRKVGSAGANDEDGADADDHGGDEEDDDGDGSDDGNGGASGTAWPAAGWGDEDGNGAGAGDDGNGGAGSIPGGGEAVAPAWNAPIGWDDDMSNIYDASDYNPNNRPPGNVTVGSAGTRRSGGIVDPPAGSDRMGGFLDFLEAVGPSNQPPAINNPTGEISPPRPATRLPEPPRGRGRPAPLYQLRRLAGPNGPVAAPAPRPISLSSALSSLSELRLPPPPAAPPGPPPPPRMSPPRISLPPISPLRISLPRIPPPQQQQQRRGSARSGSRGAIRKPTGSHSNSSSAKKLASSKSSSAGRSSSRHTSASSVEKLARNNSDPPGAPLLAPLPPPPPPVPRQYLDPAPTSAIFSFAGWLGAVDAEDALQKQRRQQQQRQRPSPQRPLGGGSSSDGRVRKGPKLRRQPALQNLRRAADDGRLRRQPALHNLRRAADGGRLRRQPTISDLRRAAALVSPHGGQQQQRQQLQPQQPQPQSQQQPQQQQQQRQRRRRDVLRDRLAGLFDFARKDGGGRARGLFRRWNRRDRDAQGGDRMDID
ncbi:hypothetical protein GGTG_09253 [Gaeumannomyces tritici R3-111a-1]|uniref:Protein kinase domain-containing protein n=1 Tax=Gaeumannomyces tritici (strain R3-111a-1) TaxID=644352 RepID=J3P6W1_GAET3|nr:hypothetical protein GGTG_09253 [Gaeumannomyces tritici R3-111a-1]EJT72387.1 hypothetical protein GGTG_09253 [Gaeumannomyces tritici R3-111a-1]